MSTRFRCFLAVTLSGLGLVTCLGRASADPDSSPRLRLQMDDGWRFHIEDTVPSVSSGVPIERWRWQMTDRAGVDAAREVASKRDISGADWQDIKSPMPDVFKGQPGFAWFQTTLPTPPKVTAGEVLALHFEGVDDNATIYLNGKKLLHHEGYSEPFDLSLDSPAWNATGPNTLAVLVENTGGGGGIAKPVLLAAVPRTAFVAEPATESFKDDQWRTVQLPHDYVVEGAFDPKASGGPGHGSLPTPKAWYRRTFSIPADGKGKSLWVDFDGIFSDSTIWFNGQYLGGQRSGYIGRRFDLGKLAHYGGDNTLAIHVDPSKQEGWWYEGGGIYRHVWLNIADPLHIEPWSTFVKSTVQGIERPDSTPSADLDVQTMAVNDSDSRQYCLVEIQVVDPEGKTVAKVSSKKETVKARTKAQFNLKAHVSLAQLWSLETPNLYHLVATLRHNEKSVDVETTPFGIRTIRFDPNLGFFLNGKPVKIKGTCNHQDFAGIGIALPDSHHEWRIRKLQAAGSNAYRTSHNAVAPEMLDACDRLGMLVFNETRHFGDTYNAKSTLNTPATDLSDLADMVRRDRNHPSVILWSIANEENAVERTPDGARIAQAMKSRIEALDGTRPVTAAITEHFAGSPGIAGIVDVEGLNYGPAANYDRLHREHPLRPLIASETTSALATRGIYTMNLFKHPDRKTEFLGDDALGYINGYGLAPDGHTAAGAWKPVAERSFVAGAFVWTGFDYRGEPHPFGWPVINAHFGFMDTCGFPKDDYYYYLAWWGEKPVVHIAPHWNWLPGKGAVKVLCHGNTERVELFLNGRSLGSKPMPRYEHLEWQVPYEPGVLEARGFNGTQLAASDKVETTGPAAALRVTAARKELLADGEDQSPVEVTVRDSAGRVVPTADNEITFAVTGSAVVAGVGNGDPSSHEPDKASKRRAFNGHCMVIVQASRTAGEIALTAESPGLKSAAMTLKVDGSSPHPFVP